MSAAAPPITAASSLESRAPALARLSPADPARLLFELVSIASPSYEEADAVSFLVSRMAELGLDASIDGAGNALGEVPRAMGESTSDPGALEVMLLGHIDTVPGGPPPEVRDGVIYGRGAVDAKGPLAVFTAVASRLAARPEPGLRLKVVGAVEEEVSSSKGARFVARGQDPPDFCVIGEPSSSAALTLGYKGRLLVDLIRRRPSSHSAGPEPTATEEVVDAWRQVQDLATEQNREATGLFARLQTELQSITTDQTRGDLESCAATFGFRLPPSISPDELRERLLELLPDFELTFRGLEPAWTGERRNPLVHALTAAIRNVAGERPALKYKTGTSDMNIVGPIWQCPILAYGPGDSRLDHTPNEHVAISEVHLAADILESALRRLAKRSKIDQS